MAKRALALLAIVLMLVAVAVPFVEGYTPEYNAEDHVEHIVDA